MRKVILKYPVNYGRNELILKEVHKIVRFAVQHDHLFVWVEEEVEDDEGFENASGPCIYTVIGTGMYYTDSNHIASCEDGDLIWHLIS